MSAQQRRQQLEQQQQLQQQQQQQQQQHHHHRHHVHKGNLQYHRQLQSHQLAPKPLPPGWVEATDPSSGKTYYANPKTQETQWERPVMMPPRLVPPPPPPPPPQQQQQPHWNVQVRVPASAAQSLSGIQTSQATGRSTGEGNALYTAGGSATSNIAVLQPEKIVMVARSMLEKVQAFPDRTTASDLELHSLNPGQIADLCKLQQRVHQQIQQEKQNEQRRKRQLEENAHRNDGDNYQNDNSDVEHEQLPPYTPINPFTMPLLGGILLEPTEPGRLDVRINSLRQELKALRWRL